MTYNSKRKRGDFLNILFCGDCGIKLGIYLSLLSILKHTKEKVNVFILTASVEERQAIPSSFGNELEEKTNGGERLSVKIIDISDIFNGYLPTANMSTRFTPLCMLRLFADKVEEIKGKILYLDTDILCRKDIKPLYDIDISDVEIAGVPDRYGKWFFGNQLRHNYLNSGVLLMNMENIRKSDLFSKCRTLCRNKKMFMPDQTALNKLSVKKKINRRFNEQGKIRKDTIIKHFTTFFKFFPYIRAVTIKPWEYDKVHNELKVFEFDDIIETAKRRPIK